MKCPDIERELQQRAKHYQQQNSLIVDYYRIRRRLAYPLPIRERSTIEVPVPGIPRYPWSIWMVWALEERINTLAWVAEKRHDEAARALAERDLEALTAWPVYRELEIVDLCLGHAGRLLAKAYTKWTWLSEPCRIAVRHALQRIVDDEMPRVHEKYGEFSSKADIAAHEKPNLPLQNIPYIGTVGVALAANALGHPAASSVDAIVQMLVEALLDAREGDPATGLSGGLSEGACYDGYMFDFIIEWLAVQPAAVRDPLFDHPQFETFLDECYKLNAPGSSWNLARLGDVEPSPAQMPFHTSAQAKVLAYRPTPERRWYIDRFEPGPLRADALAVLYDLPEDHALPENNATPKPQGKAPAIGVLEAHYALVLRNGWEDRDVAVAIAASNSPAGHLHTNNGSLNIGTRESWFITTPGYQQYMPTSERDFVLGVASRNTPAIDGQAQTLKAVRVLPSQSTTPGLYETTLDLTNCYAPELGLTNVQRRVTLHPNGAITIEDTIEGTAPDALTYYWNGHPESAWWVENGWASLHRKNTTLWFTSDRAVIEPVNLQRTKGSRGELTLVAPVEVVSDATPCQVRWFFQFSDGAPTLELVAETFAASRTTEFTAATN